MEQGLRVPLVGGEIHGFNTTADLDIEKLMKDACKRWLRPNEVHAILSNSTHFRIQPQPVDVPPSGTVVLFDRKVLRNFRKDGHNWRKKKDGKTVQEAHEKLKIGNEERVHVYYARNEDDPNFYRRCYWLLDRNLERIVLVHYRQTSEENSNQLPIVPLESKEDFQSISSPSTPMNPTSPGSVVLSEETNIREDGAIYDGSHFPSTGKSTDDGNHEFILDELDRFDWEDIIEQPTYINLSAPPSNHNHHVRVGCSSSNQKMECQLLDSRNNVMSSFVPHSGVVDIEQPSSNYGQQVDDYFKTGLQMNDGVDHQTAPIDGNATADLFIKDVFQSQNSFEKWASIVDASPGSFDDLQFQCPAAENHASDVPLTIQSFIQEVFNIVDISPAWSCSEEETKIIVVGYFHESHKHLTGSNVFCVFGGKCVPAESLQVGVYRTMVLPHSPGLVDFYITLDGHTPISQIMKFEYRASSNTQSSSGTTSLEIDKEIPNHKDRRILIRLVHLLFSTTNTISTLSSKISKNSMKEAKRFTSLTTPSLENAWMHFVDSNKNNENPFPAANHDLFDLILKHKLQEWLLLKVAEGCKTTARDREGQGVIHLCSILDYAWAIHLFSLSGLSLDFRDSCGWTALHWAAYCGREKTVAALLSARANPSLVTDPTPDFPGGCTAADLASQEGYEGLGAYLAEKGLSAHFEAMALSGNVAGPWPPSSSDTWSSENIDPENYSEQELCLKDSLAAYRNAADAADRIQAAFRERSLKQQMQAAKLEKHETEAASTVAALKIQKAFRGYNKRKTMKAAARIQGTYRTWQARKNFLNMRQKVIKIQATFRGHLSRKQYQKIVWSVGVLEKAILRWRQRRKGLRGLQEESTETALMVENNCVEEDFYRVSREQAEERVQRSVVCVQAMFRSYKAQQEYRRLKLACNQAKLEYDELGDSHHQL